MTTLTGLTGLQYSQSVQQRSNDIKYIRRTPPEIEMNIVLHYILKNNIVTCNQYVRPASALPIISPPQPINRVSYMDDFLNGGRLL